MKKLVVHIALLLAFTQSYCQEEFIEPSRHLTRIYFQQLTGGVILLKARFATFPDSLNFILDTGSGGISLDSATIAYFKLKPEPSNRTIRGIAGIKQVSFINNQKLHLHNLVVDSLNFHVNNYEILTAVYGERIDGIIGYSVFSRYIVKINYDSSFVEFWSKGSLKYPKGGYLIKPFINTLPVNYLKVKSEEEINSRFLFDLGAGLNLMLTQDFVNDSAILDKRRKLYTKEAEGLGGKIDLKTTVIKEVKLGPYRFKNVPVYIFDDVYNITSYPYLAGILGSDILRRFNLILNYEKREFYLMPNSHFNNAFDYTYTGIELYFIDGDIIIGDVAEGSPAQSAGLMEGDIVIAVNKDFSQNIQHYKASLQNSTGKAKLIIKRDGELKEIEFKVVNILKRKKK